MREVAIVPETREGLAATVVPDVVRDYAWLVGVLPLPPARLLDAGCGAGAVSEWLTSLGYRVTAIDADLDAVTRARAAGVPAIQATSPITRTSRSTRC